MRLFSLMLLMATASYAATVLTVVTASVPTFSSTIVTEPVPTGGRTTTEMEDTETATLTVGPGGAVVNLFVPLDLATAQALGPNYYIGEAESTVSIVTPTSTTYFDFSLSYSPGGSNFYQYPTSLPCCHFGEDNLALLPGLYQVYAHTESTLTVYSPAPGPVNLVAATPGSASVGLSVLSGEVSLDHAPEPGTWVLAGLGSLAVALGSYGRRQRHRRH